MNFASVKEVLVGEGTEESISTFSSGSFEYGQALMNLEFQRVIVFDWDSFLNCHMVFIISPFADSTLDIQAILGHPGFQQQPFGLQELEKFWHIVTSVPLDKLHEDSLVSLAYRVAFVANSLARELANNEKERRRFLWE